MMMTYDLVGGYQCNQCSHSFVRGYILPECHCSIQEDRSTVVLIIISCVEKIPHQCSI